MVRMASMRRRDDLKEDLKEVRKSVMGICKVQLRKRAASAKILGKQQEDPCG